MEKFKEYKVQARSVSGQSAILEAKESEVSFGIISAPNDELFNPAELFLGSLAACILKSVERFSKFMKFQYETAEIIVTATRIDKPASLEKIHYNLLLSTNDNDINIPLLKKNIEKFGTIFNTVNATNKIVGNLKLKSI